MRLKRLWKTVEKHRKAVNICLTVITVLVLFGCYVCYTPFVFSTNDDLYMKDILSGGVTGTPEYRAIFLGTLAGILISALYQVIPAAPWYGLFLCVCQLAAMMAVLYKCMWGVEKIKAKLGIIIMFVLISSGVQLQHFASIQFTVVAGIVGAAAIFWFYTTDFSGSAKQFLKANVPAIMLFSLSFCIRREVVFMLLPVAAMLWIVKWLSGEKRFQKETILAYMGFMWSILILAGVFMAVEGFAYADADWREYQRYNSSRAQIYDYYGYPDYEENRQSYEEAGISYASYIGAFTKYSVLLDENINADSMEKLAKLSEKENTVSFGKKMENAVKEFVERSLNYIDRPLNLFVYAGYFTVAFLALLTKKRKALWAEAALFLGRMIVWGYLFYQGRCPARVTQALYFAELLALLAIAVRHKLLETRKTFVWLFAAGFAFMSVWFGWRKAEQFRLENAGRLFDSSAYCQWKDYCASHPDSFYFVDMGSIGGYTEDIFAPQEHSCMNFAAMGGWLPKSPLYEKKLNKCGITRLQDALVEKKNVYVVFVKNGMSAANYLYDYYVEIYPDFVLEPSDTLQCDNGTVFIILEGSRKGIEKE